MLSRRWSSARARFIRSCLVENHTMERGQNLLRHRLLTALFGVPTLVFIVMQAPVEVMTFVLLTGAMLGAYEFQALYFRMLSQISHYDWARYRLVDAVSAIFLSSSLFAGFAGYFLGGLSTSTYTLWALLTLGLGLILSVGLVFVTPESMILRAGGLLLSTFCVVVPCSSLLVLHQWAEGGRFLLLAFVISMMGDTGAYTAGRMFGRTKLAPVLSPNKTWEGVGGGVLFSLCGTFILSSFFDGGLQPISALVICAILGSVAGIVGDLAESVLKRAAQVKDSGKLFPGHGGFLDRMDSVFFIGPVLCVSLYLLRVV